MPVNIESDRGLAVPAPSANCQNINASVNECRGVRMPQGTEADAGRLLRLDRPESISAAVVRQERRLSALAKSDLRSLAITLPKCEPNLLAR